MAKDVLGRELNVGDLVAWGHSGRYAGTRIGRVYRIEGPHVRAWILERKREGPRYQRTGPWVKAHHAGPSDPVKLDDTGLDVPKLEDL